MIAILAEIAVIVALVVVLLPVLQVLLLAVIGLPIVLFHGLGRLFKVEGVK